MPFALTISAGERRGTRYRFEAEGVTLGRAGHNEVVLNDSAVSRAHARIERRGAGWVLLDRGSANGSSLNGAPVEGSCVLRDGDRIAIGRTTFRFQALPGGTPRAHSALLSARACGTKAWRGLRPPARALLLAAGALLVSAATVQVSDASPRNEAAGAAPAKAPVADGAAAAAANVAAGRAAYERATRKLQDRRIAPRNLADACALFVEAQRLLQGGGAAPGLRPDLDAQIAACRGDLRRDCGRLTFAADRFERYGQLDQALQVWREVLLHFPADDETGCRRKAREKLISAQPDEGGG